MNEFKYLGITFDTELKWNTHIKNQRKRATASLMTGRRMVGKLWGLNPKTTDWLYKAIIRPLITYGSVIWVNSLKRQKTKNQLTKVQRLACTMITGAMRSTPTAGMEILLGLPPLDIYIKAQAQLSSIRMIRTNHWDQEPGRQPPKGSHIEILNTMRSKNPLLTYPQDKLPTKQTITRKHTTIIGTRENFTPKDDSNIQNNEVVCYTDGSKTNDGTGCGYIIKTEDYNVQEYTHLGKLTTVFQAEITALTHATMTLNDLETSNKEITYYIDSQSAIKALNTHFSTQITVQECKEQLCKLQQRSNQIVLHWIPAHKGYIGNEQADTLAKLGTNQTTEGPEPRVPISQSVLKEEINKWIEMEHNENWKKRKDCRQTKLILPDSTHEWKSKILNYERRHIRVLTQLVTGHANLKRHRYLMGMETSPTCDKCQEEEETAIHLMTTCPHYWWERMQHLGAAIITEDEIRGKTIKEILKFAQATKRWSSTLEED